MKPLVIETLPVFEPLLAPARYKGAHGGRGSGKSHFFAELTVEDHYRKPTRTVCIREIQRSLKLSAKQLVEDKIRALGLQSFFRPLEDRIEDARGGLIIFQGMQNHTSDSIKSLEGFDVAWVEEAQSLSQRSIDLLTPTIRADHSEIRFSWNPDLPTDPVDAMLCGDDPPEGSIVVEANYTENMWFPEALKKDMERDRERDPEKYQHIWLGGYQRNSEARVFHNWTAREFETPDAADLYFGADWGFANDPTVLVRCFIGRFEDGRAVADPLGRTLFVDHEAWAIGRAIDETPALFAGDSKRGAWPNTLGEKGIEGAHEWPIVADSARPEMIDHMIRRGFTMKAAIKGKGSVEDGIEFLKSYDIVVHPRCLHVEDELTYYSFETDKLTGAVLPKLADKENNTIDALRYALEGARKALGSTSFWAAERSKPVDMMGGVSAPQTVGMM
jgi:phage terminase large subunit